MRGRARQAADRSRRPGNRVWRAIRSIVAIAALLASAVPAAAERLVASISNHRVMVTSNFTGDELVLFGGIERDAATLARRGGYDIVTTIMGPRQNLVTFRKDRVVGIWLNVDSRVFENAPSYLAVVSNRPLDAITNGETLRRLQIGLDNVVLLQRASVNVSYACIGPRLDPAAGAGPDRQLRS